jgi:hypothetical protein
VENLNKICVLGALNYDLGMATGADFLYWLQVKKKITSIPTVLKSIVRVLHFSILCGLPGPILRLKEYQPDPRGVKPKV